MGTKLLYTDVSVGVDSKGLLQSYVTRLLVFNNIAILDADKAIPAAFEIYCRANIVVKNAWTPEEEERFGDTFFPFSICNYPIQFCTCGLVSHEAPLHMCKKCSRHMHQRCGVIVEDATVCTACVYKHKAYTSEADISAIISA